MKQGVEAKRWKELSFSFMTEESGGASAEEITCHKLPWRSARTY